jgi:exosortase K
MGHILPLILSRPAPASQSRNPDYAAARIRVNRLLGAVLTLLVMLMLKQHYSTAAADRLTWILAPTARMTAWLTGASPSWESGVGYADYARGIIIAPACAGLNFMIMAFGLAAFCGLLQIGRLPALLAWLSLSLAAAYGLALSVNTLRIALSMWLYQADIYTAWVTAERVHRLAGVGLYLGALGLFFKGLQPIIGRYCNRFDRQGRQVRVCLPAWWPMGWYLLGAVGVPTANLLFHKPVTGYGEHCITVVLAGLALWPAGRLVKWLNRRGYRRHAGKNTDCRG